MYIRFASLLPIAALAAVVAGAPDALEVRQTSECNTGSIQCCNSISTASNPITSTILSFLGLNTGKISGLIGLSCSGNVGSSASCSSEAVCCNNNSFSGLVVIGCTNINL